jgi:hypothetical protein
MRRETIGASFFYHNVAALRAITVSSQPSGIGSPSRKIIIEVYGQAEFERTTNRSLIEFWYISNEMFGRAESVNVPKDRATTALLCLGLGVSLSDSLTIIAKPADSKLCLFEISHLRIVLGQGMHPMEH